MSRTTSRLPNCDCVGFCQAKPSGDSEQRQPSAFLGQLWNGQPCPYCGREMDSVVLESSPTRDHIQPKSREGNNRAENLTIACWTCNQHKHYRTMTEWLVALTEADDPRVPYVAEFMLRRGLVVVS